MKKLFLCLLFGINLTHILAVTIVYNLRIAETTRLQLMKQKSKKHNLLGVAGFNQYRRLYNNLFQRATGALGNYVRTFDSAYFRIYGAIGHVKDSLNGNTFERTQTDDILFSAGKGFMFNDHAVGTITGIVGVPTHTDDSLEGIQFGTGHYSVGAQADTSYAYTRDSKKILLGAFRIIHFFPRTSVANLPNLQGSYKIELGNLIDIFLAHQKLWKKKNLTFGYDLTLGLGADIQPPLPNIPSSATLLRNSFFASCAQRFKIKNISNGILAGISYSRDSKPNTIGAKYTVSMWGAWGINF